MPPDRPRRRRRDGRRLSRDRKSKSKPQQQHTLPWMEDRDHDRYRERGSHFSPVAIISLVVALVGVVWILIEYFTNTMRPYAAILVMISLPIFIRSFFQTD